MTPKQRDACVLILGNGFSMGFGFPGPGQLWEDCLKPPSGPVRAWKGVFEEALNKYPLSYFRENNKTDIELLLSTWHSYVAGRELEDPGLHYSESGRGGYLAYLNNLQGNLLQYSKNAIHHHNFQDFGTWLADRLRTTAIRFLTFNYDLVLEWVINCWIRRNIVYLGAHQNADALVIRKLHGSVHWLRASERRNDLGKDLWSDGQGFIYCYDLDYSYIPYIKSSIEPF